MLHIAIDEEEHNVSAKYWLPLVIFTASLLLNAFPAQAQNGKYPVREGPRPQTTLGVPHIQIGAKVNPQLYAELLQKVDELPQVEVRETIISLPGAKGFWLLEELPLERPEVIVGGREFAHVHPDGSLHASLNPSDAIAAIDAGWAIAHPWANKRPGWEGFVMIYTPTNIEEAQMVYRLIADAYEYITGASIPGRGK